LTFRKLKDFQKIKYKYKSKKETLSLFSFFLGFSATTPSVEPEYTEIFIEK